MVGPGTRRLVRVLLLAALVGRPVAGQDISRPQPVPVHTCPRADSSLGRIPDGVHPHLRGTQVLPGVMHLMTSAGPEVRRADEAAVIFTVTALAEPHPLSPNGVLSVMVGGAAGRRLLADGTAPALRIELPDSIVIRPSPVTLGSYDGPPQFATAPITAALSPATVTALAQATEVRIVIDSTVVMVSAPVLLSLRDAYRTSLCGYADSPPAP